MSDKPTERLIDAIAYLGQRSHIFASLSTYTHFKRTHRERLMAKHALYLIEGRELVDPIMFDQVVIDIGYKQAKAGL